MLALAQLCRYSAVALPHLQSNHHSTLAVEGSVGSVVGTPCLLRYYPGTFCLFLHSCLDTPHDNPAHTRCRTPHIHSHHEDVDHNLAVGIVAAVDFDHSLATDQVFVEHVHFVAVQEVDNSLDRKPFVVMELRSDKRDAEIMLTASSETTENKP